METLLLFVLDFNPLGVSTTPSLLSQPIGVKNQWQPNRKHVLFAFTIFIAYGVQDSVNFGHPTTALSADNTNHLMSLSFLVQIFRA